MTTWRKDDIGAQDDNLTVGGCGRVGAKEGFEFSEPL